MFSRTPEKRGEIIARLICRKYKPSLSGQIDSLLEEGAVLPDNYKGDGVFAAAINYRHAGLIEACFAQGLSACGPNYKDRGPLHFLMARGKSDLDLAFRLIDSGAAPFATDNHARTLMMHALKAGDLVAAQRLEKIGLSMNVVAQGGYSCLHAALESCNPEVVRYALSHGNYDMNVYYDNAPYMFHAITTGSHEIYNLMRDAGMKEDPAERIYFRYASRTAYAYARDLESTDDGLLQHLFALDLQSREQAAKNEKEARTGWRLTGPHEVAMLSEPEALPYKVTEIFNFQSGLYTRINCNAETDAETSSTLDMASFSRGEFIEEARQKLQQLGGTLPAKKDVIAGLSRGSTK